MIRRIALLASTGLHALAFSVLVLVTNRGPVGPVASPSIDPAPVVVHWEHVPRIVAETTETPAHLTERQLPPPAPTRPARPVVALSWTARGFAPAPPELSFPSLEPYDRPAAQRPDPPRPAPPPLFPVRPAVALVNEPTKPVLLSALQPEYPWSCRQRAHEGVVELILEVDRDGRVVSASVVTKSPCPRLDEAAQATALQLRYQPALAGGQPVASKTRLRVRFSLD